MGKYLTDNTVKLKNSKADKSLEFYRPWLLSELPAQGPYYKAYKDDSAFMGNLWIAWQMEFFVELFANVHGGMESAAAVNDAFNKTLYNHYNFMQRQGFHAAMQSMPKRAIMIDKLRDKAEVAVALEEIAHFVKLGRPVVK